MTKVANQTFKKSEFFTQGDNGVTKLRLNDNFEEFLKLSPEDLTIVKLPEYQTLSQGMDDFDIKKHYGEGIIKTPAQILQEMHSVINSDNKTLADEYANLWFYFDESGKLRCVYCYWITDNAKWYCEENHSLTLKWVAGVRVFATEA